MRKVLMAALIGIAITHALVIFPAVNNWMIAEAQNTIKPENETSKGSAIKMIIKDNIVRIINTTTNETIRVRNLTENTGNLTTNGNSGGNETPSVSNETPSFRNLTENTVNSTTNGNSAGNETPSFRNLTENTVNSTTNGNLTAKFNELQGK